MRPPSPPPQGGGGAAPRGGGGGGGGGGRGGGGGGADAGSAERGIAPPPPRSAVPLPLRVRRACRGPSGVASFEQVRRLRLADALGRRQAEGGIGFGAGHAAAG